MSDLETLKLDDVCTFKTGKLNSNASIENGAYPFYTCAQTIYRTNTYSFDTECVILGGNNAEARYPIFYKNGKFDAYQRNYIIEPKDNSIINVRWLYYSLSTYLEYMRLASTGATTRFLTLTILKNIKLNVPSINTQIKIADTLSTYDNLIENNNRKIRILEQAAEELYKEWFVRMRFPGHEKTKFDKGIPEGWEVKKIGEMATFKRGKNLKITDAIEGDVPVIAGGIDPSCYHNESNTKAPVITVSASGANAGYIRLNFVDVWASDCSYIDSEDSEQVYYIYLLMKVSQKEILNLQLGSAQPHVYARDLNNFSFLKPPQNLIKEINKQAQVIFNEVKNLNLQNQNLIKQRDLLLPRLMNGTITVK